MKREITNDDIVLLKAIKEVLVSIGYCKTNGIVGRMQALYEGLLDPDKTDDKKLEFKKELYNLQKQLENYKKGHLDIKLDSLIKKLEIGDNRSWFNYYLIKEDIE